MIAYTWSSDSERCRRAGIPKEHMVTKSKCEMAVEIVCHARELGVRFNWVGVDGGYGKDPAFLRNLDMTGEIFVADVHKDQTIYLDNPNPFVPGKKPGRGRTPIRFISQVKPIRVDRWLAEQPQNTWQTMVIRQGTKGDVVVEALHRLVWVWDGEEESAHHWHLVVRREIDSPKEIKYSLSNAPVQTPTERLAFMQGQRFWVERSLQDGKSEAGLGNYQVRKWNSWHHHMALVLLTMLFMLETRLMNKHDYPLLSCRDIKKLLAQFLPRRDTNAEEVLRQMEQRHKKRQAAMASALRIQSRGS
ncbi:MAG: transposase [Deltaproteobacteria bacterium]|nr:transposase [Deltaproteobacteria bacterium]